MSDGDGRDRVADPRVRPWPRILCGLLALALQAGCRPGAQRHTAVRTAGHDAGVATLTRSEAGGHWGFVNPGGAWAIPATFVWAEPFSEGLAAVKAGERWGYIDRTGRSIVAPSYRDADSFSEGLAAVLDAEGWHYIDTTGTVRIRGPFESARPFHCGVARVRVARSFPLGSRVHGTFEVHEGECYQQDVVVGETLEAVGRPDPPDTPDERAPESIDDIALDIIYADANANSRNLDGESNDPWRHPDWRLTEPQWEEHVWQTIDSHGRVVPSSEVPACGATPAPPAPVPPELRARLEGLRAGSERQAFFRDVIAIGPPAVPSIVEALSDPRERVRLNAFETLVRMGRQASAAVPALTTALEDRNGDVLLFVVWALGRIGPPAASSVPALIRQHERRAGLIEAALSQIAPTDPAARALLEQWAARRRARAPLAAERGMAERHDPAAVRALLERLAGPNRALALKLLGTLGSDARAAIPHVREVLASVSEVGNSEMPCDPELPERCAMFGRAASALWRISHDAGVLLPFLEAQFSGVRSSPPATATPGPSGSSPRWGPPRRPRPRRCGAMPGSTRAPPCRPSSAPWVCHEKHDRRSHTRPADR